MVFYFYFPRTRGGIFNGYFCVDNNTNLVTSFYETINGSTNFNNNILIPTNQSFYGSPDNIYQNDWLQFNNNGVAINSMSYYTNPTGNYQYNLCSFGNNPLITNQGINVNNTSYGWQNNFYFITLVSDPTIYVNDGSILYDFLNSDREECIITNDIVVNFNLTSSNGIKTILSDNLIKITKI